MIHKATNEYGETAIIEDVPNPLYAYRGVEAMIEKTTIQVRFEGLTGRGLAYTKRTNWASFRTLLSTAQDMIANGTKFEDALTVVIRYELKKYSKEK